MNLVLISLLLGFICTFLVYFLIVSFSTLEDLKMRDWLTFWPYQHWFGEFKDMFDLKIFVVGSIVFSLMFWAQLKTSMTAREVREAAASRGECVCDCKACKDGLKLSKAAVAYLGLDAKDIEELSKDHLVGTNSIAKPTSK